MTNYVFTPHEDFLSSSGAIWPTNLETEWDDNPGKLRLVIPVRFGVFWPKRATKRRIGLGSESVLGFSGRKGPKKPETDWDDNPGKPRLVVLGFSGRKGPNNPETDWDDKPGKPRLVIPVRFGALWPNRAQKPRNGLG